MPPYYSGQALPSRGAKELGEPFIMRELRHQGRIKLTLIPTKEMDADVLTKALDDATFKRHRDTVMNLRAMPV